MGSNPIDPGRATAWAAQWKREYAKRWREGFPGTGHLVPIEPELKLLVANMRRPVNHSRAAILALELQINNGQRLSTLLPSELDRQIEPGKP